MKLVTSSPSRSVRDGSLVIAFLAALPRRFCNKHKKQKCTIIKCFKFVLAPLTLNMCYLKWPNYVVPPYSVLMTPCTKDRKIAFTQEIRLYTLHKIMHCYLRPIVVHFLSTCDCLGFYT